MFTLETPKVRWAVQILTVDYLIDGYIDGERDKYSFRLVDHDVSATPVISARFQPTGNLAAPAAPAVPLVVVYGDRLVALIPRDEAGTASAKQANAAFKYFIPAEVYVGPYVIRGKVGCAAVIIQGYCIALGSRYRDRADGRAAVNAQG